MKASTWNECFEANSSLKISPDKPKARSLIDTAQGRMDYLKEHIVKPENANYIFEGYYSSALEYLHALLLLEGYKSENHFCLGFYLRDVLKREDLFRIFDDCRFKRNSLVYYGRKMDFETAKEAIKKCIKLMDELFALLKTPLQK
jgi:uncharacterized protein (UPF0332 family)